MRLFSRHLSRLSRRAQLESAGGVTQFAEVLRLVKQTPDVVDLGQGFPDFEGNQVARDVAHFAVGSDVRLNQYTPPSGLPALHEAIASFNGRRWREELEPGVNTLVTAGGTEAIFSALIALFKSVGSDPLAHATMAMAGPLPMFVRVPPKTDVCTPQTPNCLESI